MFDSAGRALARGEYIVKKKATVRSAAAHFGVSKSTVHKDVTEKLVLASPGLAGKVRKILDRNKAERHIRGGLATREKYRREKTLSERAGPAG